MSDEALCLWEKRSLFIHLAHHQKRTHHGNNTDEIKKTPPTILEYSLELEAFTSLSLQDTRRGDHNFFWSSVTSKRFTDYSLKVRAVCDLATVRFFCSLAISPSLPSTTLGGSLNHPLTYCSRISRLLFTHSLSNQFGLKKFPPNFLAPPTKSPPKFTWCVFRRRGIS